MSTYRPTQISIPVDGVELPAKLVLPEGATALVVFAHGSGSSRHSPRNNFVAERLHRDGLGTLLFDLLTEEEDRRRENRFDIDRLTRRLSGVTDWLRRRGETANLALGYFGSSTGAAGALRAAARRDDIGAVVSRGGRVDLAAESFPKIRAPTLFVVGGDDDTVRRYNEDAHREIAAPSDLHVVDGAGHLFEGPGELEEVADSAADWFVRHLT